MARNRIRKGSFKHQISNALKLKLLIGDKKSSYSNEEIKKYIFSWGTYNTYQKQLILFSKFIKENYKECKSLEQITPKIVNSYLNFHLEKGHSAYTLKLITSAILKVTNLAREDFIKTPPRRRRDIIRGREKINPETGEIIEKNKNFNKEKYKDLIEFCKGTGLRKSELQQIRGEDLKTIDGKFYLKVTRNTKGGRHRLAEITGEVNKIINLCKIAGKNKVFQKVPMECPVHNYRAFYCQSIYNKYKRHHNTLKKIKKEDPKQLYFCRGDKAGTIYDKQAMQKATDCLGHSRIDVIAINYLH